MTTLGALGAAAVFAVHNVPQAGPFIANTLRSVFGVTAVARLEETVAAAEDSVMRLRWADKAPRSLSELSPTIVNQSVAPSVTPPLASIDTSLTSIRSSSEPDVVAPVVAVAAPVAPVFLPPAAVKPPFPEVAAPGDGAWIPVPDPEHPEANPLMFKTLLHPDPERRYTELFVVAMPSAQVKLTSVPGTEEPASENPAVANISNRGIIPKSQRGDLLAAFNGGFRAEHGHHGMMVDGVTLLEPRADMCTVFGYEDGSLQIGTFARINALPQKPVWYRQTPRCMVEQGNLHPGLRDPDAKGWGATLEGDTVIRRSAIALSQDGDTLLVAVTNSTTARALALGMRAAGGWNVAQLDVNRSFPKFLLFPRDESGARHAQTLFDGFLFDREEMIDEPNPRDFFYLVRRRLDERTEAAPQVEAKNQAG